MSERESNNHAIDPDRFIAYPNPGSQEWWYFDAISRDGRDAVVIVWYVGLPFDPAYGLAAKRAVSDPRAADLARPIDHCAVGISWYRDGKTRAYALNRYPADRVRIEAEPFSVEIGPTRLERSDSGYRLRLDTPDVDGRSPIRADLSFAPVAGIDPFEIDLGAHDSPHRWMLGAPDCRVEGYVERSGDRLMFEGRGYHDHNAGAEELSLAWKRWRWGRVHFGAFTQVYYEAEPRGGAPTSLCLLYENGRLAARRTPAEFVLRGRRRNWLGMSHARELSHPAGAEPPFGFRRSNRWTVDEGPFYLRWLSDFEIDGQGTALGFSELLDGDRLHRPWFNWMIPYRLKHPAL